MFRRRNNPQRPCYACEEGITGEIWTMLDHIYCSLYCIPTYLRRVCLERPTWKWVRP